MNITKTTVVTEATKTTTNATYRVSYTAVDNSLTNCVAAITIPVNSTQADGKSAITNMPIGNITWNLSKITCDLTNDMNPYATEFEEILNEIKTSLTPKA